MPFSGGSTSSGPVEIEDIEDLPEALDNKSDVGHTHVIVDVTDLTAALGGKAPSAHGHSAGSISGLATVATTGDYEDLTNKPTGVVADWADITSKPSDFPPSTHDHDSRYYTETEVDTALGLKAPLASPAFTGTPTGISKTHVGLGNADNTSDASKPVSTAQQTALDLKAPLASPAFTGTPTGITKAHVGLGNADNTSDANKPVSTATQTALDLKAPLASPAFTGTPTGISKTHVGLGNVDNTADTAKPVSTAQQTALNLKLNIADPTTTGKLTTAASASGGAGFKLPAGAAPTSPADGDVWTTTAGLYARINGATVGPFVAVTKAAGSDVRANTDDAKFVTAKSLADSAAVITLTDASTVAWDMALGYNAKVTITANRTIGAPTNPREGVSYTLRVIQDGTGSRTGTWNACFDWGTAGTPTLSTGANKEDLVTLQCTDASTPKYRAFFNKAA